MSYTFIRLFGAFCSLFGGISPAFSQYEDRSNAHIITHHELASSSGAKKLLNLANEKNPLSQDLVTKMTGIILTRKCFPPNDLNTPAFFCDFIANSKDEDILQLKYFGSAASSMEKMIGGVVVWGIPMSAGCLNLSTLAKFIGAPAKTSFVQPSFHPSEDGSTSFNIVNHNYFYDKFNERNYITSLSYNKCIMEISLVKPYP